MSSPLAVVVVAVLPLDVVVVVVAAAVVPVVVAEVPAVAFASVVVVKSLENTSFTAGNKLAELSMVLEVFVGGRARFSRKLLDPKRAFKYEILSAGGNEHKLAKVRFICKKGLTLIFSFKLIISLLWTSEIRIVLIVAQIR